MATLAEGVESIRLACSLVLLIPALGVALLGERRVVLVPAWIITSAVVAWLRFAGWWAFDSAGVLHAAAGFVLIGTVVAAWKFDRLATDVAATTGAATIAAWTWVPCVGRELGAILNAARAEPWAQLLPTVAFVLGLFLPLALLSAFGVAAPSLAARLDRPALRLGGLAIVGLVGGLVGATLFDDLAGELARRSSF